MYYVYELCCLTPSNFWLDPQLEEGRQLSDCKIEDGATLTFRLRLRGGAAEKAKVIIQKHQDKLLLLPQSSCVRSYKFQCLAESCRQLQQLKSSKRNRNKSTPTGTSGQT